MAIDINKSTDRIDPPSISVNGVLVSDGVYAGSAADVVRSVQDVAIESERSIRNKEELVFRGDVTVTLTADTDFTSNDYSNRSAGEVVGKAATDLTQVNKNADTYYTVNGDDPVRTKANLYTGPFTIRRNLSGDNTVLKVKTYGRGKESVTRKVDLRLIRTDDNKV